MNLRFATIALSILFIAELSYFSLNSGEMTLSNDPFSALGNIEGNYGIFLFGTSVLLIFFMFILHKMFVITKSKRS